MRGLVKEYVGIPLTCYRIAPGNTITGVAAGLYKYCEYTIPYDSGDYTFLEGDVIIGASSGAIGIVISATVATGTVGAGTAAGEIRFHSWNGTNFTDNEHIKVAADTDVGDIDGSVPTACTDNYPHKNSIASSVLAIAHTNTQLLAFGAKKVRPDQTALYGVTLAANSSVLITDASAIKNIMVVDAASGTTGATVLIGLF
jgi:hypothetical protein